MLTRPLGRDDFMKVEYIEWISGEMETLRRMAEALFGRQLPAVFIPVAGGEAAVVLVSHINAIEAGIEQLGQLVGPPAEMKPTRIWRGEDKDDPFLDYRDVNRWFESLRLIRGAMSGRGHDFKRSGTHHTGTNLLRQRVRVV